MDCARDHRRERSPLRAQISAATVREPSATGNATSAACGSKDASRWVGRKIGHGTRQEHSGGCSPPAALALVGPGDRRAAH